VKPEAELTIVVTDDKRLQQLNRDYLEIDAPTDVLSFPSGEVDPETGKTYLGDVLISFTRAAAQAEAGGHPVEDELKLLVVHGVLHLLGFDHREEEDKERMWAAQTQILKNLGLTNLST
jgi:probable rRNA maturation factor